MNSFLDSFFNLLGGKGEGIKGLLSSSFRLLGQGAIMQVLINRIIFAGVTSCLLLFSFSSFFYHFPFSNLGIPVLIILLLIIYPYAFFYHVNRRARQVWLSYAEITKRPATMENAVSETQKMSGSINLFGLVELTLANANGSNQNNGIFDFIVSAALYALEGLFEIAEDYLLPAVVIEKMYIRDAADKLRQLQQNVPTVLAGSFGLDILGALTSSLLGLPYLVIVALGITLALGLIPILPADLVAVIPYQSGGAAHTLHIFWFPVFLSVALLIFIGDVIKIVKTSIEAMYFSIFYTVINHPDEISADAKQKLEVYLKTAPATAQITQS